MHWIRRHRLGRPPHPDVLTPAEWRVLEQVREGHANAEIAVRMGVSQSTVRTHLNSIYAKTGIAERRLLAQWDGQPGEVSREALGRGFALPLAGWFTKGAAMTGTKVAVVGLASVAFIASLFVVYGSFFAGGVGDDHTRRGTPAPTPPLTAELTEAPTEEATTSPSPELHLAQVIGESGCAGALYARAIGLPSSTAVRIERGDPPTALVEAETENGALLLDEALSEPFGSDCGPGAQYEFRLVDSGTGDELVAIPFTVPDLTGRIEVDPPSGGCGEITVALHDMPPDERVDVIAGAPQPFAHSFYSVISLATDAGGSAQSELFAPPWQCSVLALSLFATAGDGEQMRRVGELLYRVALEDDAPLPGLDQER